MLYSRVLNAPKGSFFLLGPRGTGKSTWLKSSYPDAHLINLLRENVYQDFLSFPEHFTMEIEALATDKLIIIDEVQRLPNLLNEVHRLIEDEGRKFILCGSSARKLKRAGINLLAGRAAKRSFHPFIPEELKDNYNLNEVLRYGSLPIIIMSEDKQESLEAYCQLYLKEEIQAEALVRNLPGFARFLPVAATFHGENINISNIARECGVARTTVSDYIEILEETLLCFRVPGYEAKLRTRERKLPKLYWCDPGIVRTVKKSSGILAPEEKGAIFEGLVAQTIRAYKDYNKFCDEIYYWTPSSKSNVEVDFLIEKDGAFAAVEVKSGANFTNKWCKGLRAVASLENLQKKIIVYPEGPEMATKDDISVVPFLQFCKLLAQNRIFES